MNTKATKQPHPILLSSIEDVQFLDLLSTLNPDHPPHVLSMGAGIDSLALFIEYVENPDSRDFPIENLICVHSVLGGESKYTKQLMEEVCFPLCRKHNIWFLQAYRNGEFEKDGTTILSSTRQPTRFYLRGDYRLFAHLIMSGTVPQRGGSGRLCTLKFKGWVIDQVVQALFGDSPRQRFIGFNADESKRAEREVSDVSPTYLIGYNADEVSRLKDRSYGDIQPYHYEIGYNADEVGRIKESPDRKQTFRFPLIEMGHGRQWCEDRVAACATRLTQGRIIQGKKSFCVNSCPFSECNGKKRQKGNNTDGDLRQDWLNEPIYGGEAAFIEHVALAINSEQPLFVHQLVLDVLQETNNTAAIAHYEALLDGDWVDEVVPVLRHQNTPNTLTQVDRLLAGQIWAVYCVRRMFTLPQPGKRAAPPFRQTVILFQGSRAEVHAYLRDLARHYGVIPQLDRLSFRFWTHPRPEGKNPPRPFVEEQFVACPATVIEKQRISIADYDLKWLALTGSHLQIKGVSQYHEPEEKPTNQRVRVVRSIRGAVQ